MGAAADSKLADAWLRCALGRGISHEEHVRVAFVLLRRHGRSEGARLILEGTQRNCAALDAPERYDEALTRRWASALADAVEASDAADADTFLRSRPELGRSDLFGLPSWKLEED
jgi:hypothetical protein